MKSMVELSHDFLLPVLHRGAVCVDATLGRGKDSQFFLEYKAAEVVAFEIQEVVMKECTIQNTRFHPYLLGHERMDEVIHKEVDAMIFNFGYCPGKSVDIHTQKHTSMIAIKKGLSLLKKKGRMALVFYPHEDGKEEARQIENYVISLDSHCFTVLKMKLMNQENSPYLIGIEKK